MVFAGGVGLGVGSGVGVRDGDTVLVGSAGAASGVSVVSTRVISGIAEVGIDVVLPCTGNASTPGITAPVSRPWHPVNRVKKSRQNKNLNLKELNICSIYVILTLMGCHLCR